MFWVHLVLFGLGFMSTAAASANTGMTAQSGAMGILPFVVVIGIFYFLIIRPQTKRAKEQKALVESLQVGDHVITDCSIIGKIAKIDREHALMYLEIQQGVSMQMSLDAVYAKVDNQGIKADGKSKTVEAVK